MTSVLERYRFGTLVDPESVEEISAALETLASDPLAWQDYRNAAHEAVRSELQWELESVALKREIAKLVESHFNCSVTRA
jgi:glycosyltransferase involved in cell wall biosynthesis